MKQVVLYLGDTYSVVLEEELAKNEDVIVTTPLTKVEGSLRLMEYADYRSKMFVIEWRLYVSENSACQCC